ncbi:MAG: hypothetical protein NWE95_03885 [Candidatus Bathyarchaeota archaeon]|nr:hypothetical protein [Candidatus Bathyarchaeota archaeon]
MNIAEFVVVIGNPFFPMRLEPASVDMVNSAVKYAVDHKVFPLFYDGCSKNQIYLPSEAHARIEYYQKHREMQIEASKAFIDICEKLDFDFMFFKTFRPFNYIPDDVDILLSDNVNLKLLVNELKKEGYFILKVGTPEIVLRKVDGCNYVDLDVHKRLAVGSLDIFNVKSLWQKNAYDVIKLGDGYQATKLSEDYEVVREAAYSLLKDFHLSIAGLYLGINAMINRDLTVIKKIAIEENFSMHLSLYLDLVYSLACELFESEVKPLLQYKRDETLIYHLCKNLKVPYPYPIPAIACAYLSKALLEINRKGNVSVIPQIMKQPASKGINILLDYVRNLSND